MAKSKLEITKTVAGGIVGLSTAFTVSNVLKNNVSSDNPIQKAEIWIGSTVVGLVVAERAERYIGRLIDTLVLGYDRQQAKY